jgi:hypothetical protein
MAFDADKFKIGFIGESTRPIRLGELIAYIFFGIILAILAAFFIICIVMKCRKR